MNMDEMPYAVWKTNRFNEEILTELVAYFSSEKLAQDFCDYQASQGERYIVKKR